MSGEGRTPLVLVPGLLLTEGLYAHQIRHLADTADVTVADTLQDDSIQAMADRLLAAAPERFALGGLSMGGYVALAVMATAPERVTHLALMDTQARADGEEAKRRRRALLALSRQGKFKGVTPRLLPQLIHPDRLEEPALVDPIMARPDRMDLLPAIRCPTLVMVGRQDALIPLARSAEMAEAIPGARLAVIEECGHLPTMERPQAATALLRDWLVYSR